MSALPLEDLSKLCIHTITTRPWSLDEDIEHYSREGVAGITVWRDAVEEKDARIAGRQIQEAGMQVVSLCRGGFFPARESSQRAAAIEENLRIIDQAVDLGAPLIVLVCGAVPGQPLAESRRQIRDGIAAILPHAEACQVKLAVEPLHPMYADTRSAINTLKQANDLCAELDSPFLGVVVDVYHVWWDPELENEIRRCGEMGKLFAFHICDWKTPEPILYDRALMGEGCIPIREIRGWMERAGFGGFNEVEIFSLKRWATDQQAYLLEIKEAYLRHA
jgi:sugar phosphate isomerase/epimerase